MFIPEFLQTYLFPCVKIYIIRVPGFLFLYEEYLFFNQSFILKGLRVSEVLLSKPGIYIFFCLFQYCYILAEFQNTSSSRLDQYFFMSNISFYTPSHSVRKLREFICMYIMNGIKSFYFKRKIKRVYKIIIKVLEKGMKIFLTFHVLGNLVL